MHINQKPIQQLQRPPTLHEAVRHSIKTFIIDNNLQVGDPIPSENELAGLLGVSRNLIREVIRSLEAVGIVEIRRGSGIFVRDFSFEPLLDHLYYGLMFDLKELSDILVVRRAIEVSLIEDAIQIVTPEQIAELRQILEQMRQLAESGNSFPDEDRRFHQCLFERLGNSMVLKVLDIFWLTFHKASERTNLWDQNPALTYQLHVAVVEAVAGGSVAEAQMRLREHYHGLEQLLLNKPAPTEEKGEES